MQWLRHLWAQLIRRTPAGAQRHVDTIERNLAELRAKVSALPAEQRPAFAKEIHSLIEKQAQARANLNDALDDRDVRS